ncbi:MAG: ATP-dependent proteinase [Rickettsiaceae bacterium]|jgi:ATP-dependent Lon protease|nr:ATP-dependent proteinase [Rickettsiaceae bacterium]
MNSPNLQIFYAVPLRDAVVFPHMTTTIVAGRAKSIKAIQNAKKSNIPVFVVTQINADEEEFEIKNVYSIGVACRVVDATLAADGNLKVVLQGLVRGKISRILPNNDFFSCEVEFLKDEPYSMEDDELIGLIRATVDALTKLGEYNKKITPEVITTLNKVKSPNDLVFLICTFLSANMKARQAILEESDVKKRLYKILELIQADINIANTESQIAKNIQAKIAKSQKELYLHEQLKHIKKELGQDEESELQDIKNKIAKLKLPKDVAEKCQSEISKLEKMNLFSSEAGVVRNYLDWIIKLPWHQKTKANNNLEKSQKILDKNHYALSKIKDRILEFIAVQMKTNNSRGPILCFVGAPGVGKTSLAKAIADSLGRNYVKVALGGVRDEAEIRGHRRTYIGSMPGRIIQSMKKAKVVNPLMLLDEIDKMSYDMRGDPSSALLEVLDPEQNKNFSDHYLEVDYDLSNVMFVATANNISNVPAPLRDRMEIIRLSGYTEEEKLNIAKQHLLPKQRTENGISAKEFSITDDALLNLIRKYTFEAGVRNLNREIASLARKVVKKIISGEVKSVTITEKNLGEFAGIEKFHYGIAKKEDKVGVATGLAYTDFGGDLLDIEAVKFTGSGKIQITGKLGEVMKESAQTALSYVRSIANELKIPAKEFNKYDFHIHVPEGAMPKDGPSAGVAICSALVSAITGLPVNKTVAMTGEITLTGRVLEIGGLKEKLLAALRGGIKTVIIPEDNKKDLEEMPEDVKKFLKIKTVSTAKEALKEVLIGYKINKHAK